MNKILKATSKGQITLPSAWRKKFDTDNFLVTFEDDTLEVRPLELDKVVGDPKDKNTKVIFNAARDNKGKGISAKHFLKTLKKING